MTNTDLVRPRGNSIQNFMKNPKTYKNFERNKIFQKKLMKILSKPLQLETIYRVKTNDRKI